MTAITADITADEHPDCATHEGLRQALNVIKVEGWESEVAREVLAAVRQRSPAWAAIVDRRCRLPTGTTDPGDVITTAWITMSRFADNILRAKAPWAYLWTSVGNALAVDNADHAYLSRPSNARADWMAPVRAGLEDQRLAGRRTVEIVTHQHTTDPRTSWSPALHAMLDLFAEAGGDEQFWAEALDHAVNVMAQSRRSYEVLDLRHDPYMLQVLGLTPPELSALAALMIGPRRGVRGAGSLLVSLHRDVSTDVDRVPGARARLALLTSRPHTLRDRLSVAA